MFLTLDNRSVVLEGAPLELVKNIGLATSYLVKGHKHVASFQQGHWDGRKKLLSAMRDGRVLAPVGLAQEIADIAAGYGYNFKLHDLRHRPEPHLQFNQVWDRLRPYQRQAAEAAVTPRGSLRSIGHGLLKMPPRSGKTLTSASIIAKLGVRTLFVTTSRMLLHQGRLALSEALGVEVGIAGDSEFEIRDVTVASIQSLCEWRGNKKKNTTRSPRYDQVLQGVQLVIFDECHHLEGDEWRKVIQDSDAAYKLGLSATVFLDRKEECELGVIWLRACTGDLLIDISASDLIRQGYLVRPEIRLYPIREPDLRTRGWSRKLQKAAILLNDTRNGKVVDVTRELVADGMKVVVIVTAHDQLDQLCTQLRMLGTSFRRVVGSSTQVERECAVADLVAGRVQVLIGTVFGEGVDIPEIDAVVNAEGGADPKKTYQRLRCMTPCKGKDRAVVVDFIDMTHHSFARHSLERLAAYRNEPEFKVAVIE